ncbi:hypothetical protein QAD02_012800 [Eretmocerus hayati]|uniref:Uncharacterized protein n=1 Tax=Eretmocerus hayati TaxID=131215 RepID=A0ACC2P1N6_9HYME|nr:hypothetical protein QAD02_012800 [Eretmocerus hayati]
MNQNLGINSQGLENIADMIGGGEIPQRSATPILPQQFRSQTPVQQNQATPWDNPPKTESTPKLVSQNLAPQIVEQNHGNLGKNNNFQDHENSAFTQKPSIRRGESPFENLFRGMSFAKMTELWRKLNSREPQVNQYPDDRGIPTHNFDQQRENFNPNNLPRGCSTAQNFETNHNVPQNLNGMRINDM